MTMFADTLTLRDYQAASTAALRDGLRKGHFRQILCAPTGAGKTEMAIKLIDEARAKRSRVAFVADRRVLVKQTSTRLSGYGIPHGVAMAGETRGGWEPVQVCSAQTLEARGFWPDLDLLILDEAHNQRTAIIDFARTWGGPTIGLTATPLTPGLSSFYTSIVNSTTTNELLKQGWLAPLKVYEAKATIDMTGAGKVGGEWTAGEVSKRSRRIVGDIVSEWVRLTQEHFGGPVKTLLFSADVAHGEELCQAFQGAGYDFRQSTYRDSDTETAALVDDFRMGEYTGLVSVEKFCKGFDVPDVMCGIDARPNSSSVASVIQKLGRLMRIAEGKEFGLWLCHSENIAGWWEDIQDVWQFGVQNLPKEDKPKKSRREKGERPDILCPACGFVTTRSECDACGYVRRRRSQREIVAGRMEEVTAKGSREWKQNEPWVWQQVSTLALQRREGNWDAAQRSAAGYYKGIYGRWPRWGREIAPNGGEVDERVRRAVVNGIRRWKNGGQ